MNEIENIPIKPDNSLIFNDIVVTINYQYHIFKENGVSKIYNNNLEIGRLYITDYKILSIKIDNIEYGEDELDLVPISLDIIEKKIDEMIDLEKLSIFTLNRNII